MCDKNCHATILRGRTSEDCARILTDDDASAEDGHGEEGMPKFSPLGDRLYGGGEATSRLLDACSRVARRTDTMMGRGAPSETFVVCGSSGTGKSSFVHHVGRTFTERQPGGNFIYGSFDSVHKTEPLSTVIAALDDCCGAVMDGSADGLEQTRAAIRESLGSDVISVLVDVIPRLRQLIGGEDAAVIPAREDASAIVGAAGEVHIQLKHSLGMLLRAMAGPTRPLVMVLDDMELGDVASLEIIGTLATDSEIRSVLFVFCYRDNEVTRDHPLSSLLGTIQARGVPTTMIRLGRTSRDAMNEMMEPTLEGSTCSLSSPNEIEQGELIFESSSTRICVLRNVEKWGSRTGSVVVKRLTSSHPDPGQISRLYDEYIISKHLARCRSVRAALMYSTAPEGLHALLLEWAPGVTLREWISEMHSKVDASSSRAMVRSIVGLSWEIARALSEIHCGGVLHNDICVDNIIVETTYDNEQEMHFAVKIIDFGSACFLKDNDQCFPSLSFNNRQRDICSLGVVLYEVFSGQHPLRTNSDSASRQPESVQRRPYKTKRAAESTLVTPLHEIMIPWSVPMSVSTLVSNLMKTGSSPDQYLSVRDVELDLHQLLVDDKFLFGMKIEECTGQLEFPTDRLYGRDSHMATIMSAYERVIVAGGGSELVLVSGYSGTGKSALAHRVRDPVLNRGGHFIFGKFDQLQQAEPFSAIIAAFTGYCEDIIKQGGITLDQIRDAIQYHVGSDDAVLTDLIPNLRGVIGGVRSSAVKVGSIEAQNRFKVIFGAFVRAIASASHPVILLLDDLQWADVLSLELLRSLVADTKTRCFLLVGCYRDNEVDDDHPLTAQINELLEHDIHITMIKTENIGKDDLNQMVSETLHAPLRSVEPLTDVIYRKTAGNAFFVIHFLRTLWDEGLLHFSFDARKWLWNIEAITSYIVGDNVVELMTAKIMKLSADARSALEVAACLGSNCVESTLGLINGKLLPRTGLEGRPSETHSSFGKDESLSQRLDDVVNEGLLTKEGTRYRFVHDQIQLAAYSLLPEKDRGLLHLEIGNNIWKSATAGQMEELLFVAIDQLNRGSIFVDNQDERTELARLNLRAGKKAIILASFLLAARFLNAGIGLLPSGHWNDEYTLSLQLYELCAEAEYCSANFESMALMIEEIFQHARCFDDRLSAYSTLVNALGAQGKLQEAIATAFFVLEKLGEPFPDSVDNESIILSDFLRTRDMLEEYSDETLVTMRLMEDDRKKTAMWFLYPLIWYTMGTQPEFVPLITFRMMQVTLRHGACEISAFGFAMYGSLVSVVFGDIERGYQFGQFALSLLDRFKSKRILARVHAAVFGICYAWKKHIALSCDPLLYGYNMGMTSGDVEFAMGCAQIYCHFAFECGKPLVPLEEEMKVFCNQMSEVKQDAVLALLLPFRQTTLNLMGYAKNPLKLTGEAMEEDKLLKKFGELKNSAATCFTNYCSMFLAYLYGDYDAAAMAIGRCGDDEFEKIVLTTVRCSYTFYCGLSFLALGRKTMQSKWTLLAKKTIEKMEEWAKHAPCNCEHKLRLLEAESAFLNGQNLVASEKYDEAIVGARDNRFLHNCALANERAGIFHAETGDMARASHYFDQAQTCYLEWGARDKANHVRSRSLSILMANNT